MLKSVKSEKKGKEGYVYVSYGHPKYLKHTIASVSTLRRYDKERPIALVCNEKHRKILEEYSLSRLFDVIHPLPEEHASICLLYTYPSPRDYAASRMPSSA